MEDHSLFFIAIIPPQTLREEITKLKAIFSKTFATSHSLKSPPHITLVPPLKLDDAATKGTDEVLKSFCSKRASFNLVINGFGAFAPRVIYLKIGASKDLSALWADLLKHFPYKGTGRQFTPHITLAFRDLSKKMFHRAWEIYKHDSFVRAFEVSDLVLLKHNGKNWDIYEEYPFQSE